MDEKEAMNATCPNQIAAQFPLQTSFFSPVAPGSKAFSWHMMKAVAPERGSLAGLTNLMRRRSVSLHLPTRLHWRGSGLPSLPCVGSM